MSKKMDAFNDAKGLGQWSMAHSLLEEMVTGGVIGSLEYHRLKKELPSVVHEEAARRALILRPSPIRLGGLQHLRARQFLVKRLNLERGMLVSLCGTGASGKTLLAQYLALSVANNLPVFGHPVETGSHRVLHVDQEQSEALTQRRYERLAASLGIGQSGVDRLVLPQRLDDPSLSGAEVEEKMIQACRPYGLVILDSLRQSTVCDENNSQIAEVLHLLRRIAEKTNSVFLFIHHKGKGVATSKQSGGVVRQSTTL